jgi:hypothetical protein
MWDLEYLLRALSELVDLALDTHLLYRIANAFDIYHAFVCKGVKEIEGFDGFLSSLLEAKDEVNPLVKMI